MHNVILQNQMDAIDNTKGVSFKDAYIRANIKKDFVQADFRGARLQNIKVGAATFTECDFSGAEIAADITHAKFINCNFEGAIFQHTYIYESAFIDNNFKQTHFLHSSVYESELSKNDFENAKMDDVNMKDITVNEPNRNGSTIQYGYPSAIGDELKVMKANCMNELAGVEKPPEEQQKVNARPEFVRNSAYDFSYTNAIYAGISHELDFQINHGFEDKRDELQYLVDRYCHEEVISGNYLQEKLEKYNQIAEQKYGTNEVKKTENQWEAAVEEVLEAAQVPEPDFEMEM